VETLFITAAKQWINTQQWKRPAFSMGSDPSLHATVKGTVVFYGVWSGTTMWKCLLCGLFTGYIAGQLWGRQLVKELVMTSDGKGCHKSWLQQLGPRSSEQEKRLSCCEL
jgi:hypothetical protein